MGYPRFSWQLRSMAIVIVALLCSCGGGAGGGGEGATTGFSTSLAERTWSSFPAANSGFKCSTAMAQRDLFITGFRAAMTSEVVRMVVTVADTVTLTGDYDCTAANMGTTMIYFGNRGVNDFTFPTGKGVVIRAGQFVTVNAEIDNPGAIAVSGKAQLLVSTGGASSISTPVEMTFNGNRLLNIPNDGTTISIPGNCLSPIDQTFLSVSPAMNRTGTRQQLTISHMGVPYYSFDRPFDFNHQLIYPDTPEVHIAAGDNIQTICNWINNGPSTLFYTDDVSGENCFTAIYRYPVRPGNTIFECVP